MVSAFCIAAPTRPLPRLFPAVCASTLRLPAGNALHCLTTVLWRFKSVHFWGVGMVGEVPIVCRPSPVDSITPRLAFVKRGACKPESQHCCATVFILPSSRRSSRSACHWTCYMVRLGAVAPHVRRNEIVHPVASASGTRYHMVRGERQRMRGIATPVERFAAIIAGCSSPFGAFAQDGAIPMVESRILTH